MEESSPAGGENASRYHGLIGLEVTQSFAVDLRPIGGLCQSGKNCCAECLKRQGCDSRSQMNASHCTSLTGNFHLERPGSCRVAPQFPAILIILCAIRATSLFDEFVRTMAVTWRDGTRIMCVR